MNSRDPSLNESITSEDHRQVAPKEMLSELGRALRNRLGTLDERNPQYVSNLVECLLQEARVANASDIHLQPLSDSFDVRWRVDGVLHPIARLPGHFAANTVARLKVLSDLLTYKSDVPQEGRIRTEPGTLETRVSIFPTIHGEKAVVRLFADPRQYQYIDRLELPDSIQSDLEQLLAETSGAIILAGPAGSGKTTTLYACLREIVRTTQGSRSLVTLEDPVEVAVSGVSQSQVNPAAGFTLECGLRSILRQDPEVIAIGEIRDRGTAEVAMQASLTGHLILATFHAGSASAALSRLSDMRIEPYLLRSAIRAVLFQRLARKLCACAQPTAAPEEFLGLPVKRASIPIGCETCRGTGYSGRIVIAEMLHPDRGSLAHAVLQQADLETVEASAIEDGMVSRWHRALTAIESGLTSPREIRRILGFDPIRSRRKSS